jgi:hypothetical protein
MASWAAIPALSGFHYSAVDKSISFGPKEGNYFWSNGYAWGNCAISKNSRGNKVALSVVQGKLNLSSFALENFGKVFFKDELTIPAGSIANFELAPQGSVRIVNR